MRDPWDTDSRHPANQREAERGTKNFLAKLRVEGEYLNYLGVVEYRTDSEGLTIESISYFPPDESVREEINDWVRMNLF